MADELTLAVGQAVSLVRGNKTYRGTVALNDGLFVIKLANVEPGEPDEISIHIL